VKVVKLENVQEKKRGYLKEETMNLKQTARTKISKTYIGINEFKKGYRRRPNLAEDENIDLLANTHNILDRGKNFFCQLLNGHGVNDVMQKEMHIAKPLLTEPIYFKV
jgi:hypothetical protein